MLRGAIFDMDGVLVDNLEIHRQAFIATAHRYGVDVDVKLMNSMNGMGNDKFFAALFPADIIERVGVEKLADEKERLYREMYAPVLTPATGLIPFLERLKAARVKMAVGSSGCTANVDFILDGLGIRHFFIAIVNGDMVARTKPSPDIYLLALRGLGLSSDECLVFEDAVAGVQAAAAAGVKVVGLTTSLDKSTLDSTTNVVLAVDNFTRLTPAELSALL